MPVSADVKRSGGHSCIRNWKFRVDRGNQSTEKLEFQTVYTSNCAWFNLSSCISKRDRHFGASRKMDKNAFQRRTTNRLGQSTVDGRRSSPVWLTSNQPVHIDSHFKNYSIETVRRTSGKCFEKKILYQDIKKFLILVQLSVKISITGAETHLTHIWTSEKLSQKPHTQPQPPGQPAKVSIVHSTIPWKNSCSKFFRQRRKDNFPMFSPNDQSNHSIFL